MAFLIGGANSAADTGFNIENSLRFNDGDSAYLSRNPSSTGNQDRWTWSGWFKRSTLGAAQCFFASTDGSATSFDAKFDGSDNLDVYNYLSGGFGARLITNRVFRDVSAWYHIVIVYDSGNATEAHRLRIYVNGTEESSFSTTNYPSVNEDSDLNVSGSTLDIGRQGNGSQFFDGYMAEIFLLDGTVYAPSDFGETDEDSGIWKPKDAKDDLTFGTNGFFMEFKQSGTGTDSSGMGADTSGEDNHYAVTNLTATDQTTDTPTNNFCTWNPLFKHSLNPAYTPSLFSEGNLKLTLQNDSATIGTIGVSKGKWYYEYKFAEDVSANANYPTTGYTTNSHTFSAANMVGRATASDSNYDGSTVYRGQKGSTVINAQVFLGIEEADDIIGWYLDLDNETIICHKNGSTAMGSGYTSGIDWSSGLTTTNAQDGFFYPMTRNNGHSTTGDEANFGNPPFAISSSNADANGYGNFEFDPTIGGVNYYALCSKNLAEFG